MANRPTTCITVTEAKNLQQRWDQTRGEEIENALGYVDCRDFWYSIEELEDFIAYVKDKSNIQGVQQPGVRIYFAADPAENGNPSLATVFLAPTSLINGRNQNNYNIDPLNHGNAGNPPIPY